MNAFNNDGIQCADGVYRINYLKYHNTSLEALRRLFAANPDLTPMHFHDIFQSVQTELHYDYEHYVPTPWEDPPDKRWRNCRNLSYLLLVLRVMNTTRSLDLPITRYLTKKELFSRYCPPSLKSRPLGDEDMETIDA